MSDINAIIRLAHRLPRICRRFEKVHNDDVLAVSSEVIDCMELMQNAVERGWTCIAIAAAAEIDNRLGRIESLTKARTRYKDTGDILGLLSTYRAFVYGNR